MKISDVRVLPVRDSKVKAYVTLVVDGGFLIHGLKIVDGDEGLVVVKPYRRLRKGMFKDLIDPVDHQVRRQIDQGILDVYQRSVSDASQLRPPLPSVE